MDAEETERILTVLGQVHGVLSTEEDISEGDQVKVCLYHHIPHPHPVALVNMF